MAGFNKVVQSLFQVYVKKDFFIALHSLKQENREEPSRFCTDLQSSVYVTHVWIHIHVTQQNSLLNDRSGVILDVYRQQIK